MERCCTICHQAKPLTEFDVSGRNGGKMSYCKACRRKKRNAAYVPHPEPRITVEAGQRFGRLTVIQEADARNGSRRVACTCECGTQVNVLLQSLIRGESTSCGCLHREQVAERNKSAEHRALITKHGMVGHALYSTWTGMMERCGNPGHQAFRNYGGRGITVCEPWHDVATFITWIERNLGPRPDGCTLDRIDNDGNYEPGNVQWATRSEQARNRRRRNADSA